MFESLRDNLFGAERYCWQVIVNGKPFGYLCEDYEMFRDLILGSNIPATAIIRVQHVYCRYTPVPQYKRINNPFTSKGERKKQSKTEPEAKPPQQFHTWEWLASSKRKRKRVWHWGTRGRRRH